MSGVKLSKFPFPTIRPKQEEVIGKLEANWDKFKYFIIEAPTGFGKSALARTITASNKKAFVVTATKQLQDQYMRDFAGKNVTSLKGRANYSCNLKPELNVECGMCVGNDAQLKHCKSKGLCTYYSLRERALNTQDVVLSYQYFLYSCLCGGFWKKRDVLVIDEAHLLESALVQWATIEVDPAELKEKYNLDVPAHKSKSGYKSNAKWLHNVLGLAYGKREELFKQFGEKFEGKQPDDLEDEDIDEILVSHKEYYEVDKLCKRLDIFFDTKHLKTKQAREEYYSQEWLIEPDGDKLLLTPVSVGSIFQRYVSHWADKVIFMSATILDMKGFARTFYLPKEDTASLRIESEFPPERSPIIYKPVGDMSFKKIDETIPRAIEEVKRILSLHKDEKGIIHTGNYKVAQALIEGIDDDRLIMRGEGESNESIMARHVASDKPTVLVSPSLTTGADLKDELSRFQIVVKLPWLSLADKRVKAKIDLDNDWYTAEMFRTFVQACGRSTRSEEDWSNTYVLDEKFYYWVQKSTSFLPRQFLRRIKWKA